MLASFYTQKHFFQTFLLFTFKTFLYHSHAIVDFPLSTSVFFVKGIIVNERRLGNMGGSRLSFPESRFSGAWERLMGSAVEPLVSLSEGRPTHCQSAHFLGDLVKMVSQLPELSSKGGIKTFPLSSLGKYQHP